MSLYDESLFEQNMRLKLKVKALKEKIEEYESGQRYLKLQKDHHRVMAGYIRENNKLRKELASSHAQCITVRNIWTEQCYELYEEYQSQIRQMDETIRKLEDKVWELRETYDDKITSLTSIYKDELYEKDCIIDKLKHELAHAKALLGRDSTNTSLPTSQTPIDKQKRIPNTREKSGKAKGGQPGHQKHSLQEPEEAEITDVVEHGEGEEDVELYCPDCLCHDYVLTGESEVKYEYDIQVNVRKIKHVFHYYRCIRCGTEFRTQIPPNLKERVQYGPVLQALALSLTNTVNSAMNKTAMLIAGLTGEELTPCEGYIAKLQQRAARALVQFREELKGVLITRKLIYWDDTVIMILTERACLRFYGDDTIAYYTAHNHKDMASIDDDQVLELLDPTTKVMHDHNTVNYNKKFLFENIECNQHLQRDAQKNTDNTGHVWSSELKKLIGKTIGDRNAAITQGKSSFTKEYVECFCQKLDNCLDKGWIENEGTPDQYGAVFERRLLRRISAYVSNYFSWLNDFGIPTTNNLSERALRGAKSHMKVSGQFESEAAADNYALIRSYVETCRRNSINEIDALRRLCNGEPYSVNEIFSKSPP